MTYDIRQKFAANLNRLVNEKGYNQSDLARTLNISTATASGYFTGRIVPRIDKIEEIANWLNVPLPELFGYESLKPNKRSFMIPLTAEIRFGSDPTADTGGEMVDYLEHDSCFAFVANISFMNITEGDIVIVNMRVRPETEDLIVGHLDQGNASLYKLNRLEEGWLLSNSKDTHFIPLRNVPDRVLILGRVMEVRSKR